MSSKGKKEDSRGINVSSLLYNPNGTSDSSTLDMHGGSFNADSGNTPGQVATAIYGNGKMTTRGTKVAIGAGAVGAAAENEGESSDEVEAEEESKLKDFLSNILTCPPQKINEIVEKMEEDLQIYEPEDLLDVDLAELKKVVKGAQFTKLKKHIEKMRKEQDDGQATANVMYMTGGSIGNSQVTNCEVNVAGARGEKGKSSILCMEGGNIKQSTLSECAVNQVVYDKERNRESLRRRTSGPTDWGSRERSQRQKARETP